jgi:hypothetical protein
MEVNEAYNPNAVWVKVLLKGTPREKTESGSMTK